MVVASVMNLPARSFSDLVRDMSASITASAGKLLDVSVGSVLRAIIDANAAIGLWMQWLVTLTLQMTRAATSTGPDLDSWMADFSFARLPALPALGVVTFSRYSGVSTTLIAPGTLVKTVDGSTTFSVTSDTANPAWQAASNAYAMAPGVMSLDLPVSATIPGSSGNALAGTVTLLASAVPGVDAINNSAAMVGGADPETDAELRSRFTNFFAARSKATEDAIGYAISQVSPALKYNIQENTDSSGNFRAGSILISVDDGSGVLSSDLMNTISTAVAAVRALGTTFVIQPAQNVSVQVSLSLALPAGLTATAAQGAVETAIMNYVAGLPLGGVVSISRIIQAAYLAAPQLLNISELTLNGQGQDIQLSPVSYATTQTVTFT
jgi:uncharacterized phage protein gp47/JayE